MPRSRLIVIGIILAIVGTIVWALIESNKPKPGEPILQDGRDHKPEGTTLKYNSNPPTSGDHYASWIFKGFYDTPRIDGNVVHSLEHGYVVIYYNCQQKSTSFIQEVSADQPASGSGQVDDRGRLQMTQGGEGSAAATLAQLPPSFSDGSCDNLKKQLKDVYNKLGPHKIIVQPRVGIDHSVILTAWGRIERLNQVDSQRIKKFINAFRDQGPEQTDEP